jgi:hypothetical protein
MAMPFTRSAACVIPRPAKRAEGPHGRNIDHPKDATAMLEAKRIERKLS